MRSQFAAMCSATTPRIPIDVIVAQPTSSLATGAVNSADEYRNSVRPPVSSEARGIVTRIMSSVHPRPAYQSTSTCAKRARSYLVGWSPAATRGGQEQRRREEERKLGSRDETSHTSHANSILQSNSNVNVWPATRLAGACANGHDSIRLRSIRLASLKFRRAIGRHFPESFGAPSARYLMARISTS
jgi:hypothetical protein